MAAITCSGEDLLARGSAPDAVGACSKPSSAPPAASHVPTLIAQFPKSGGRMVGIRLLGSALWCLRSFTSRLEGP